MGARKCLYIQSNRRIGKEENLEKEVVGKAEEKLKELKAK